jgi:hypothetical protein
MEDCMLPDDCVIPDHHSTRDGDVEEGVPGIARDGDETVDNAMISYNCSPFYDGMGTNRCPLLDVDTILYQRRMTNGNPFPQNGTLPHGRSIINMCHGDRSLKPMGYAAKGKFWGVKLIKSTARQISIFSNGRSNTGKRNPHNHVIMSKENYTGLSKTIVIVSHRDEDNPIVESDGDPNVTISNSMDEMWEVIHKETPEDGNGKIQN